MGRLDTTYIDIYLDYKNKVVDDFFYFILWKI